MNTTLATAYRCRPLRLGVCGMLLLLSGGCHDPLRLEERVVSLQLRGVVTTSPGNAPLQGANLMLGRMVFATDTGDRVLATTSTGAEGAFTLDVEVTCGPLGFMRLHASAPGYQTVRRDVQCTRQQQIFNFILPPDTGPP
jgi:hypothetical protein